MVVIAVNYRSRLTVAVMLNTDATRCTLLYMPVTYASLHFIFLLLYLWASSEMLLTRWQQQRHINTLQKGRKKTSATSSPSGVERGLAKRRKYRRLAKRRKASNDRQRAQAIFPEGGGSHQTR